MRLFNVCVEVIFDTLLLVKLVKFPDAILLMNNVILVSASEVARPTKVSVEVGRVIVPEFIIVANPEIVFVEEGSCHHTQGQRW